MRVQTKEAEIRPVGDDEAFPGAFEVILSAPTKDRDGDTLKSDEWKQPLPDHITFDVDHGMSVQSTVGSGVPSLDDGGNLRVSGTYSSLPRAQEVRTLVREGHIRTTSVAFLTEKGDAKDGGGGVSRELLNGAFVAVPSNREALVLASKSVARKEGRRNSSGDAAAVQAIHDHAAALGAACPADSSGAAAGSSGGKAAGYEPEPYHAGDDETVKCPACGKLNDTDAKFCDQCGAKLPGSHDAYAPDADESVKCPQCGKLNAADAKFCDQCGTKLAGNPAVSDDGKSASKLADGKSAAGDTPDGHTSAADKSAAAAEQSAAAADESTADEIALRARAIAMQATA